MLGGFELLTLLVEDSHRRLDDRVQRQNARDRSLQVTPPSATTAAPTPPGPPAPSEPSKPSDTSERGGVEPPDDVRSRAFSHAQACWTTNLARATTTQTEKLLGKEVPLLTVVDQKEENARWNSEVTLGFPTFKLDAITYGGERYDSTLGNTSMKYHTWYDTRRVMAFTAMVPSLDMNLRDLFKVDDLKDQMEVPSLLHELKPGQTVEAFVAKSEELVRRPGAIEQHTVWCGKNDRCLLTRSDATRRLRQAEQARKQVDSLQSQVTVPRAAQASHVNEGQVRKTGKKKRQGAKVEELAKKKAHQVQQLQQTRSLVRRVHGDYGSRSEAGAG
ncbi:hypothetical protein PR003_g4758 [Phytophthora rubi]|uniref:Uncharacterized protein n=1 Tax=Phytophthora rubi TaxID=129364 RepID=A0A6A4FUY6_9STRA|nr:hypothetical protein PR003_g4758 [Phytophthora rubi]